ncbi:MAG: riboflavin synthase [Oleiphilaceae bacterium]
MFTGIIESLGSIDRVESRGKDLVLSINSGKLDLSDVHLGDSIAVNGVCLTVTGLLGRGFTADVSAESLANTNIKHYSAGTHVNLEKALTLATRLGGHMVSGHVDVVGIILDKSNDGRSIRFEIKCPQALGKYIANKGSITVDGVSLTVTGCTKESFSLNIVPHTVAETTIQTYQKGQAVHVEVDLIARYTERLLAAKIEEQPGSGSKLSQNFLSEHGFI